MFEQTIFASQGQGRFWMWEVGTCVLLPVFEVWACLVFPFAVCEGKGEEKGCFVTAFSLYTVHGTTTKNAEEEEEGRKWNTCEL